jgi:HlyD family secretion protein
MKFTKGLLVSTLGLALATGVGVWGYQSWRQPATTQNYKLQTLSHGDVAQSVSATGTLNPVRVVSVGTQVSGTVKKLYVDFNDHVKQGQVLLELDTDLMQAKLQQSQAALASASAKLRLAQAKAVRMRDLFRQQYISQQELDEAEADLAANQAQTAQINAQVQSDSINVGNTIIRSPVSGIVINRAVDQGQTVAASFQTPTLITIAQDLSQMQINASFSEADLGRLKVGQTAGFRVDAFPGETYQGTVRQIRLNPTTQQNVVTYDVIIDVANPELKLLPGMTAYVDITLEERQNVLLAPNAALRFKPASAGQDKKSGSENKATRGKRERGMAHVYVLEQNQPKEIRFKAGISDGKYTEVLGNELTDGVAVIVGDAKSGAAKGQKSQQPPMRGF